MVKTNPALIKVINISNLDLIVSNALTKVEQKFREERSDCSVVKFQSDSITYLFGGVEDTIYFGQLLNKEKIQHSYHLAEEYESVATKNMDVGSKALHKLFNPSDLNSK